MNANPANCTCERCEIDRARALPNGRGSRPSVRRPQRRSVQRWMPWKTAAIATRRRPMGACWR